MRFFKSKSKIYLLLACLIVMLIGIPILLKTLHIIHSISVYIVADAIFLPFAVASVLNQLRQCLEITDKVVFHNGTEVVSINIVDVKSIKYRGTFLIPMSEMLVIESKNMDMIYIDFNFVHYRDIWTYVVNLCQQNQSIDIDNRLRKLLGKI